MSHLIAVVHEGISVFKAEPVALTVAAKLLLFRHDLSAADLAYRFCDEVDSAGAFRADQLSPGRYYILADGTLSRK